MKIIIAGAGAVGTHLAKLFSQEHHDITLMDENPEKLEDLASDFDILTLPLSPSSISALREAEVDHADLFIGVTPDEAHNMTACMLASKLGAKKTVARVDNYEYTLPEHREFFRTVGIDSIIYPEMLAAKEILLSVQRSWVRNYREIHDGKLIMLAIKLREGAKHILYRPIREVFGTDLNYRIVAIKRKNETIMPDGNTTLELGDIAYFMTTRSQIREIRLKVGKNELDYPDVHNVIIMGGGRIARHVAENKPASLHMKIIERDRKQCERLEEVLDDDIMVVCGDGRDTPLLREEGIENYQAFVALTDNTETNILACLAAKQLGVKKTVAMVENTDYLSLVSRLDIGTIINKKGIAASHIYRIMLDTGKANISSLTITDAEVAEFEAEEDSPITKNLIRDIPDIPKEVVFGGRISKDGGEIIKGDTQVCPGDTVVVFCKASLIKQVAALFRPSKGNLFQRLFS